MINNSKPILLVDVSYAIFYKFFALRNWYIRAHPDKEIPDEYDWLQDTVFMNKYRKLFFDKILKVCRKNNISFSNIVFNIDCKRTTIWRSHIFQDYKTNRPDTHRRNKFYAFGLFKIAIDQIIPEFIKKYNCSIFKVPECEADDIIAQITLYLEDGGDGSDGSGGDGSGGNGGGGDGSGGNGGGGDGSGGNGGSGGGGGVGSDCSGGGGGSGGNGGGGGGGGVGSGGNGGSIGGGGVGSIGDCSGVDGVGSIGVGSIGVGSIGDCSGVDGVDGVDIFEHTERRKIYILGSDTDYIQICNHNIILMDMNGNNLNQKYLVNNITNTFYLIQKILIGDVSDNIPQCYVYSHYLDKHHIKYQDKMGKTVTIDNKKVTYVKCNKNLVDKMLKNMEIFLHFSGSLKKNRKISEQIIDSTKLDNQQYDNNIIWNQHFFYNQQLIDFKKIPHTFCKTIIDLFKKELKV